MCNEGAAKLVSGTWRSRVEKNERRPWIENYFHGIALADIVVRVAIADLVEEYT
jgi:hypothetical protein